LAGSNQFKTIIWIVVIALAFVAVIFNIKAVALITIGIIAFFLYWFNKKQ
jgi:hypothetical protein